MIAFSGNYTFLRLMLAMAVWGGLFLPYCGAPAFGQAATDIVVVDPGHGGPDRGAVGDNGLVEKSVSLALAESLGSLTDRGFQAKLIRTGDYHIPLQRRTGMANHLNARAFVSIHTGGSFHRQAQGMTVYYYDRDEQALDLRDRGSFETSAVPWETVQERHRQKSRRFAERIKSRLEALPGETPVQCRVVAAPMAVLAGADMPAVLIEVGYIQNARDSRRFQDKGLVAMAGAIAAAIGEFLQEP